MPTRREGDRSDLLPIRYYQAPAFEDTRHLGRLVPSVLSFGVCGPGWAFVAVGELELSGPEPQVLTEHGPEVMRGWGTEHGDFYGYVTHRSERPSQFSAPVYRGLARMLDLVREQPRRAPKVLGYAAGAIYEPGDAVIPKGYRRDDTTLTTAWVAAHMAGTGISTFEPSTRRRNVPSVRLPPWAKPETRKSGPTCEEVALGVAVEGIALARYRSASTAFNAGVSGIAPQWPLRRQRKMTPRAMLVAEEAKPPEWDVAKETWNLQGRADERKRQYLRKNQQ